MTSSITTEELNRLKEIERKQKERYKKQNEHTNKLYDRISFTVPKGKKKEIESAAEELGITVNKFVSEIILKSVVDNDILKSIFNNNIYELCTDQAAQEPQISPKLSEDDNSCIEQETSENEANSEVERLAGIQALIDAKRAEEKAQEEKIQKMREERKEQQAEEFREMMRKRRSGEPSEEDQEKEQIRQDTIARAMCEL